LAGTMLAVSANAAAARSERKSSGPMPLGASEILRQFDVATARSLTAPESGKDPARDRAIRDQPGRRKRSKKASESVASAIAAFSAGFLKNPG
jgi:hypothetical protein